MAEGLGQRALVGLALLLAWMLLFHLLVNIWLLCVFTSLLVVLGGWLGSQVFLESNSVIHLERFIRLEQLQTTAADELRLDQEVRSTVQKVLRDFVTSWFSTVSSDSHFEAEVQAGMISMATELRRRARNVDRKELTQKILSLLGRHLQDFLQAGELMTEMPGGGGEQLWRAYSSLSAPHVALSGAAAELNYIRATADVLLHVLVPPPHLQTRTGRFVVGELVSCNVLLPLVDRLSDPDWLNLVLIAALSGPGGSGRSEETAAEPAMPPQLPPAAEVERNTGSEPSSDTEPLREAGAAPPEGPAHDGTGPETGRPQNPAEDEEAGGLRRYVRGTESNPSYRDQDSDLDSPSMDWTGQDESPSDRRDGATTAESSVELDLDDVCTADGPKVPLSSELVEDPTGAGGVPTSEGTSVPVQNPDRDAACPASGPASGLVSGPGANPKRDLLLSGTKTPSELTVGGGLTVGGPTVGGSPVPAFSFEPLSSPEGPVLIQNLRITGTITAKEHRGTGSHPYTLYTIKYETLVGCEAPGGFQPASEDVDAVQTGVEPPSAVPPVAYHMVNRRYSEFLNLQTRLEEKMELRRLIKGVKGPKKMFPDMPFGNMDSDRIEARKGLLETFLKQLCAIPEVTNSEEMQEFLALNTDARIAFVKKPFLVSRIDKIVVNAIVDTLKTAFPRSEPQSPTDDNEADVDGGRMSTDKKSRSRLKLSGRGVPFMNGTDLRPPVLFTCDRTNQLFNGMVLEDLQAFITEQEKLFMRPDGDQEDSPVVRQHGGSRRTQSQEDDEMALAELALSVLRLLMKNHWDWLCSENVQRAVRLLLGTLIDRWLDVSVSNLTSTRSWVVYLRLVQEAVWPGGVLPSAPPPERSRQQRDASQRQALQSLMQLLPDLVRDLLGAERYRLSWKAALDSFQDPVINRHLVFCLFDLLLDVLIPETSEEAFQRNLLDPLRRKPEKLLLQES